MKREDHMQESLSRGLTGSTDRAAPGVTKPKGNIDNRKERGTGERGRSSSHGPKRVSKGPTPATKKGEAVAENVACDLTTLFRKPWKRMGLQSHEHRSISPSPSPGGEEGQEQCVYLAMGIVSSVNNAETSTADLRAKAIRKERRRGKKKHKPRQPQKPLQLPPLTQDLE